MGLFAGLLLPWSLLCKMLPERFSRNKSDHVIPLLKPPWSGLCHKTEPSSPVADTLCTTVGLQSLQLCIYCPRCCSDQLLRLLSVWQVVFWPPYQSKVVLPWWAHGHWLLFYFSLLHFTLIACLTHAWVWTQAWHVLAECFWTIHVFFLSKSFIIIKNDRMILTSEYSLRD